MQSLLRGIKNKNSFRRSNLQCVIHYAYRPFDVSQSRDDDTRRREARVIVIYLSFIHPAISRKSRKRADGNEAKTHSRRVLRA